MERYSHCVNSAAIARHTNDHALILSTPSWIFFIYATKIVPLTTRHINSKCFGCNWTLSYNRFGTCEPYKGGIEACNGVYTEAIDYVFIANTHRSQENISTFLKENILTFIPLHDMCRDLVYQIICKFYLSPCGAVSAQLPPSSICPEDCSAVQKECPAAWDATQYGLKEYNFINCNNTSAFLFPLPSCCTGVDLQHGMWW